MGGRDREAEVRGAEQHRRGGGLGGEALHGRELHQPHAERADDALAAGIGAEPDRDRRGELDPQRHLERGDRTPPAKSASVITPIVFCASLEPWLNAITDAEASCATRKRRWIRCGCACRKIQSSATMITIPTEKPISGATKVGISTLSSEAAPLHDSRPGGRDHGPRDAADQAVRRARGQRPPPGEPGSRRWRRPARRASPGWSPPRLDDAVGEGRGDVVETSAPTRFSTAAANSATLGGTARVEIEVATALAASWKPFV